MSARDTLLVEIGTEELPPHSLQSLGVAFAEQLFTRLADAWLIDTTVSERKTFYTPRRLAVTISDVSAHQEDRVAMRKGPLLAQAFDSAGKPTAAARGFAKTCGVEVDQLIRSEETGRLMCELMQSGMSLAEVLSASLTDIANALPVAKRMRWGVQPYTFARPVRWLCVVHGREGLGCSLFDIPSKNQTYAHRFHYPNVLTIRHADEYSDCLRGGKVIADFFERRQTIADALQKISDGHVLFDEAGLDEAAALTEYPQVLCAEFEPNFLALPAEVVRCILRRSLKAFPIADQTGTTLLPQFAIVSNGTSEVPDEIISGYQRVARPRFADAVFFFAQDKKIPLAKRCKDLSGVIFEKRLGTLADKVQRVTELAGSLAAICDADKAVVMRAAQLCKCDLTTDMVQEYSELEGVMGKHYALAAQESPEVAAAIAEQYRPCYAGDALPDSQAGIALALADKLDTITGLFGINRAPTGAKDPFALRRSALGIIRILIEKAITLDLHQTICSSLSLHHVNDKAIVDRIVSFFTERMKGYSLEHAYSHDCIAATLNALETLDPLDFFRRLKAVASFMQMSSAESLVQNNKRIRNLLKQNPEHNDLPRSDQLVQAEEKYLFEMAQVCARKTHEMITRADYLTAIGELVKLRAPIDDFFDSVLVMSDDACKRENRLRLLLYVGKLFYQIADFSEIVAAGSNR